MRGRLPFAVVRYHLTSYFANFYLKCQPMYQVGSNVKCQMSNVKCQPMYQVGSNTLLVDPATGVEYRGREYPWGIVNIEDQVKMMMMKMMKMVMMMMVMMVIAMGDDVAFFTFQLSLS